MPLVVLFLTALIAMPSAVQAAQTGTPGAPPTAELLEEPPVLANLSTEPGVVEVELVAAPAQVDLGRGVPTPVWAFNGSVPGPTLEVREGDRVVVRFRNDLDEPTTIHWHGLHLPFESDGSPFHPVAPGERHDYVFTIPEGTAGTYWYHPHPHHRTTHQVSHGLFGALIVRADDDPLAGFPERLLILTDNRFREDGTIDMPEPGSMQARIDEENGREGDVLFVNGQVAPRIDTRVGEVQRWRIVNASAARVYRLAIPGSTMLHVGSDGGLFDGPLAVPELVLANSERAEVLVSGDAGGDLELTTLPYDRYIPQTRPRDWKTPRHLLTLHTTADPPVAPMTIPDVLRPVEPIDASEATTTRVVVLSQGMINNRKMDAARVDITAALGSTEIWEIENVVGMDHPFHLHGFRFQILDRNDVPVPVRSWKDSVNVPKHERLRIIVRFEDYPGKWMFHCHILNHEDMGMMGVLEVS
ncbi:MAG TPA: multicopper oxidase family protein [Longimicrobiales bacterium]|nr:multicopper oxidase family protein [Longimicrobiales bacterium]